MTKMTDRQHENMMRRECPDCLHPLGDHGGAGCTRACACTSTPKAIMDGWQPRPPVLVRVVRRLGRVMGTSDSVHGVSDEAAAEYARWEHARPAAVRISDGPSSCAFDRSVDEKERRRWETVARSFMRSPMAPQFSSTYVLYLLPHDQVVSWGEEIEKADGAVIVTPLPAWTDEGGWDAVYDDPETAELVVVELKRNHTADPFERIANDEFTYCAIGHEYEAADLAASALTLCTFVFWATDTDQPAAFDMSILWPLGNKPGDDLDNSRVSLYGSADAPVAPDDGDYALGA